MTVTRTNDGWRYYCHHCNAEGFIKDKNNTEFKVINFPSAVQVKPVDFHALQPEHYAFLKTRGISQETADSMKLFAAERWFQKLNKKGEAIGFPYYKDGKMTAAKYRSIESKDFTQDTGGAQTFFGIDKVDPTKPIIIVEGEMDALTAMECGIENVVSVPSGAPMSVKDGKIDASEDRKFAFVWDANDVLQKSPYIVIATDNDPAGHALAEELSRRIGKERCRIAKSNYKDINELFLAEGKEAVEKMIEKAEPFPVVGLSSVSKFKEKLYDLWENGTGKGESTGYSNIDEIYTIAEGQLSIVTGYPSCGKSNFIDQLMVNLAKRSDWKFAVCSFENQPPTHISRFMELYQNKRFLDGTHRMTEQERDEAFEWVNDHFIIMDSETIESATIDSVLDRAKAAVAQMGIRGLVIDPYNYIDNKHNGSETDFISQILTKVQAFAKSYGVHVWFIAHPAKVSRTGTDLPRPDGMSISGSMAWWAKADCGVTVHRTPENSVQIAIWKCRYRWIGTQGETTLGYDKVTGSYFEPVSDF
jgi:twinkle protein